MNHDPFDRQLEEYLPPNDEENQTAAFTAIDVIRLYGMQMCTYQKYIPLIGIHPSNI